MAKWTDEEIKYLKDNYAYMRNKTLAKNLNRKIETIKQKAYQLNLRKKEKIQLETGMKFGRLTILKEVKPVAYPMLSKDGKTYISKHEVFLCVCDCGNEKEIRASSLLSGATQSCGCLRNEKVSENGKKVLASFLNGLKEYNEKVLVESTKLDQLNKKVGGNNTSGHKGVCWVKQSKKWKAYINFQGQRVNLGYFENKEDAIKARLKAEEEYFVPILEKYKDVFDNEK